MTLSDQARQMNAARKRVERECPECGRVVPMLTWQKYCGLPCNNRAKGRRRKERQRGHREPIR